MVRGFQSLFKSEKLDSPAGVLWGTGREAGLHEGGGQCEADCQLLQLLPLFTGLHLVFPWLIFIQIFMPDEL